MFCPNCGTKNPDDARFCTGCGKQLPQATSADAAEPPPASPPSITITCPGCGVGLEVDGSLAGQTGTCPNCGAAIEVPSAPPTPASAPDAPASAPTSISGAPSPGSAKDTRKPEEEKKPKSALRSYLAKQARDRPVQEIKPVSKVFLWCLAIGPFVAGMIAGPVAIVAFAVTALVFLVLDQRAIKKSGRSGDGALWYFLILFIGFICIPVYLFCSGKDTKRGGAPGFVYLALLAASVVFAILWNGSSKANEDSNSSGTVGIFSPKTSVQAVLKKANKAQDEGNVNLCGFYIGMDRSDAEALAKHYHLADDEYSFIGDPVWGFGFSLKGIRRLTNGGDTKEELFQSVANRVGNFKKDRDGIYHYRTIDGIHVMMSEMLGIVKMEETTGKTRNRAREKSVSIASPRDVKDLIAGMVRIPGKPFLMGRFEVTQAQWAAVMGNNPSGFADAGCPVENVSWDDCQTFLEKLNALPEAKASGMTFRLPTDEEWEYACRAGATGDNYYRLGDGTDVPFKSLKTVAWVSISWLGGGVDEFNTHRVGRKKPNAFGLYDMIGNVWEWTSTEGKRSDTGKTFVVRGGCYAGLNSDGPNIIRMTCSPSEWTKCGLRLCAETAEAREAREEAARAEFEKFITSIVSNMVPIRLLNCRIGKYEVTQTLWEAVMGENPSEFKGADNPVENVSWDDCQEFLQKLNALPAVRESGLTFRLPTDEEWEVACRAGSTGNYCLLADGTEITADTLRRVAWYTDNSVERTHRVGQKQTNAFGLYDMHGNVWEWTQTADGEARVLRGGCWCSSAGSCESSYRGRGSPSDRNSLLGFRLCASGKAD